MWKLSPIAASRLLHRIAIGSVLVLSACEPQQPPHDLSPDLDATIGSDLSRAEPGKVASAAIRHLHEELVAARPELGSAEIVFDPTFPVAGGQERSHPNSVTDELSRSLTLRLAPRMSVLRCSEQEPRQCKIERGVVLMRMGEVSIQGQEASVVVEVTYEVEGVQPWTVYSAWQELALELEAGAWSVSEVRMRGVT